jgi:hypothetical protein
VVHSRTHALAHRSPQALERPCFKRTRVQRQLNQLWVLTFSMRKRAGVGQFRSSLHVQALFPPSSLDGLSSEQSEQPALHAWVTCNSGTLSKCHQLQPCTHAPRQTARRAYPIYRHPIGVLRDAFVHQGRLLEGWMDCVQYPQHSLCRHGQRRWRRVQLHGRTRRGRRLRRVCRCGCGCGCGCGFVCLCVGNRLHKKHTSALGDGQTLQ